MGKVGREGKVAGREDRQQGEGRVSGKGRKMLGEMTGRRERQGR